MPGQGWKHLTDFKDLYMAKIAYNPTGDKIYCIGGATDQRSKSTLTNMFLYHLTPVGIHRYELASMNDPRASFGALYNPRDTQESIIVAGGYINGKLSTKSEVYNIKKNVWTRLPELNESKASSSLCVINDQYILCMGGLSRNIDG